LTDARELVDEHTGKIAFLGLAPIRLFHDGGDRSVDGVLLVALKPLVGTAECDAEV